MVTPVTVTQEQLDALIAARVSGILTSTFGGRSVTYQSPESQDQMIAWMTRQLNPTTSYAYRLAAHDKGV